MRTNKGYFCGGALIAPDIVLYAAHCQKVKNQQVSVGAYKTRSIDGGAQDRFCESWIVDPEFDGLSSDFALCKLNEPVYGVVLELNEDDAVPAVAEELRVVGLGLTSMGGPRAEYLQELTVPHISTEVCNSPDRYNGDVTDQMFCAGYLDASNDVCYGDSGGPIVRRQEQEDGTFIDTHVGVVSWGYGCARLNFPGVYARTSSRVDWIKSAACNELGSIASFCGAQASTSFECDADEGELLIQVTTDARGTPSASSLQSIDEKILNRRYLFNEYENNHRVCIKYDEWYEFAIYDLFATCYGGTTTCGSYHLSIDGKEVASGVGNFYTSPVLSELIRISPPTESPSAYPSVLPSVPSSFEPTLEPSTEPSDESSSYPSVLPSHESSDQPSLALPLAPPVSTCQDKGSFKITKKEKSCGKFVKGGSKALKKKCNRMWKGDFVYDWCPDSCGKKAGIGSCAYLKDEATNDIGI